MTTVTITGWPMGLGSDNSFIEHDKAEKLHHLISLATGEPLYMVKILFQDLNQTLLFLNGRIGDYLGISVRVELVGDVTEETKEQIALAIQELLVSYNRGDGSEIAFYVFSPEDMYFSGKKAR